MWVCVCGCVWGGGEARGCEIVCMWACVCVRVWIKRMGGTERDCVYVSVRVCFRGRRGEKKKKIKISKKGGGRGRSVRLFSGRLNVLTA